MKALPKKRAHRAITSYIVQHCLALRFGNDLHGITDGFNLADASGHKVAEVGDLVVPKSAPNSVWYLSWVREIKEVDGFRHYLLESVETGEMCSWSNIGIAYLDRDVVEDHPEWQWTDRQFEFNDRWNRVCYRERDAYMTLPRRAVFGDGFQVTLGARTRFSLNDYRPSKTFDDFRKVTKKVLAETYDAFVADRP